MPVVLCTITVRSGCQVRASLTSSVRGGFKGDLMKTVRLHGLAPDGRTPQMWAGAHEEGVRMRKKVEGKGASRRPRRSFTAAFKAEVVALVRQGDDPDDLSGDGPERDGCAPVGRAGGSRRGGTGRADD